MKKVTRLLAAASVLLVVAAKRDPIRVVGRKLSLGKSGRRVLILQGVDIPHEEKLSVLRRELDWAINELRPAYADRGLLLVLKKAFLPAAEQRPLKPGKPPA